MCPDGASSSCRIGNAGKKPFSSVTLVSDFNAVSLRVSPKTAEAFGRYLHLSHAEAVQEILIIMIKMVR